MKIQYLQHVPFEGPANIAAWAEDRGHIIHGTAMFQREPRPELADFDWLVVLGGPMSVDDEAEYPWLVAEKRLIERAVMAGRTVLGVCLGSQLLAEVLGARVSRNACREIGWFPVSRGSDAASSPWFRDLPESFPAFHWHGDAFELPAGAHHLLSSAGCAVQAFAHGHALGLLCHLEATRDWVSGLIHHCGHEIGNGPFEQQPEQMLAASAPFDDCKRILWTLLDRLARD